jgi:hypothetical protein
MANPTSNFNWQMPTASDLVTDLPADFEVFGQAVDTSLADLKGGTTGQVLSKASNTNMDFTWVTTDDANAIQNSIVDAKGDIVAASANDTPARLAVGNNGETLVADSSTSTGLRYQANFAAGKNKIINGDFGVWQRGTSFSTTVDMFSADRFFIQKNNTNTISQQTFTPGTAPVAGYEGQYFLRYARTTVASGTDYFYQRIEDVRTLAGTTATFSFWAKADTAISIGSIEIDQMFGSGGSSTVSVVATNAFSVTTSWVRYSYTVSIASIAGKTIGTGSHLRPRINFTGAAATFDTWGWQLEAGNTATAFQTATGTLQGELAACQRYYYRTGGDSTVNPITMGIISAATTAQAYISVPVTMRIPPTSVEFSTLKVSGGAMGATAVSAITLNQVGKTTIDLTVTCSGASFTNGAACIVQGNGSTSNYLGLSAEL